MSTDHVASREGDNPEFAVLKAEINWLESLLKDRDNFIVRRGLWQDFVDGLSCNSPVWKNEPSPTPSVEAMAALDEMAERRDPGPAKYALGSALRDAHRDATTREDFAERAAVILAPAPSGLADAADIARWTRVYLTAIDRYNAHETDLEWNDPEFSDFKAEDDRLREDVATVRGHLDAALAGQPAGDGWLPIGKAPYAQEVEVRAGMMQFRAKLVRDASLDASAKSCDQWQATREGEHPPCWSDGACWEVNEDLSPSLQPEAWRPLPSPPAQRPVQGGDR